MDGREQQNAGDMRRSSSLSGQQVPLNTGKLRVGVSGKPVPALFPVATSKRARSKSQQESHVTFETNFQSPFRRRVEVSKPQTNLSGCSPLSRYRANFSSTRNKDQTRSTGMCQTSAPNPKENNAILNKVHSEAFLSSQRPTRTINRQQSTSQSPSTMENGDGIARNQKQVNESIHSTNGKVATARASVGPFVLNMPCQQSSLTAREQALLTHRVKTTFVDTKLNTRYHDASHPHSMSTSRFSPISQLEVDKKGKQEQQSGQKRPCGPSQDPDNVSTYVNKWQQVHASLDHIHENDPSIDWIELRLLHHHNTFAQQQQYRQLQQERNLAAASILRKHQSQAQRRLDYKHQQKVQLQHLSEAIRRQNQRVRESSLIDRHEQRGRDKHKAKKGPTLPARKPLVPRLSRPFSSVKSHPSKPKNKSIEQLQETLSFTKGTRDAMKVATPHEHANDSRGVENMACQGENRANEKLPLSTEPDVARRKLLSNPLRGSNTAERADERAIAAKRARDKRRAIARVFMQRQQQSRRIGRATAKAQFLRAKETRQRQLELLEATRLKNLSASQRISARKHDTCERNDAKLNKRSSLSRPKGKVGNISKPKVHGHQDDQERSEGDDENEQAVVDLKITEPNTAESKVRESLALASRDDERVQKLLELKEKAAALSVRLSGLRNRTDNMETKEATLNSFGFNDCSLSKMKIRIEPDGDTLEAPALKQENNAVIDALASRSEQAEKSGQDEKSEEIDERKNREERADGFHRICCDSKDGIARRFDADVRDDDMREQSPVFATAADSSEVHQRTEAKEEEMFIQSIGVDTSAVVGRLQQPLDTHERVSRRSTLSLSSSGSSPLSCDTKDAIKATLFQQLKRTVNVPSTVAEKINSVIHLAHPALQPSLAFQQECEQHSPVNAGLVRLIRATDDSLSVIDRVAKTLFRKQQERSTREKDEELQERMQAKTKALAENELPFATVMESSCDRKAMDKKRGSEDIVQSRGNEKVLELPQYKRLEEIVAEVERECAQENEERSDGSTSTSVPYDHKEGNSAPVQGYKFRIAMPSSVFWDHLVAEPFESQGLGPLNQEFTDKKDLKVCQSSEFRHQTNNEDKIRGLDTYHRAHSPRTLSKHLLAAVDYQEAILGAHMQLSKMEDAFKQKQELQRANLRECSVQTDSLQKRDAAIGASLSLETPTSPIRLKVDAAVQQDAMDLRINVLSSDEVEDSNAYDETFEDQSQENDVIGENRSTADVLPSSACRHAESEDESERDNYSVNSHEAKDQIRNERNETSVIDDKRLSDSNVVASIVDSMIDDTGYDSSYACLHAPIKSNGSVPTEYEDDFEASSPKPRAMATESSPAIGIEDGKDELQVSSGTERSGKVRCLIDSSRSNDSRSGTKEAIGHTSIERQGPVNPTKVCKGWLHEVETTTEGTAYQRDLARRKQAEDSLLYLRLQAMEQKYQHEVKQLAMAVKSEEEGQRCQATLTMAFLAETALIKSLKAASKARYYQDLHTFRSLMLDEPHAVDHRGFKPVKGAPIALAVSPACEQVEARECEEYTDEFPSDSESSIDEGIEEKSNDSDTKGVDARSRASEHQEIDTSSIGHDEMSEMIKVAECSDVEQEKEHENSVPEHEVEKSDENVAFGATSQDAVAQSPLVRDAARSQSVSSTKATERQCAHCKSEYADDFVSASETSLDARFQVADALDAEEAKVKEQVIGVAEPVNGRAALARELDVVTPASCDSDKDVQSVERLHTEDQPTNYDGFDCEYMDEAPLPCVELAEPNPSESEDSSMTARLVAEVATLQETSVVLWTPWDDQNLAHKKIKVTALLQAKAQLVHLQTEAFRHDEEKRQVNRLAKLALQVDVAAQVQYAKDAMAQHLARDFSTLRQQYPILEAHKALANQKDTTKARRPLLGQSTLLNKALDTSLGSKRGYQDEYEVASFEDQSASQTCNEASVETDQVETYDWQGESGKEKEVNDAIESKVASQNSDIDEDIVSNDVNETGEDEEEASAVSAQSMDDANDYDNESFDDTPTSFLTTPFDTKSFGNEPTKSVHEDDDVYANDAFDSASESSTYEAHCSIRLDSEAERATPAFAGTAHVTVDNEALTDAIEQAETQFKVDCRVTGTTLLASLEPETKRTPSCRSTCNRSALSEFVALSRDEIDEALTASLEDQTARLEALHHQVAARSNDLVGVQKQMRVERRRGKVVAQAKAVWDELERIQRLLIVDKAALAVCGQRNRLDMMQLEARDVQQSMDKKVVGDSRDWLRGFDYIESAQADHKPLGDVSRNNIARADKALDYIEPGMEIAVERGACGFGDCKREMSRPVTELSVGNGIEDESSLQGEKSSDRKGTESLAHDGNRANDGEMSLAEENRATVFDDQRDAESTVVSQREECDLKLDTSFVHTIQVDLLRSFAYVEAVETGAMVHADRLTAFDYVEPVDVASSRRERYETVNDEAKDCSVTARTANMVVNEQPIAALGQFGNALIAGTMECNMTLECASDNVVADSTREGEVHGAMHTGQQRGKRPLNQLARSNASRGTESVPDRVTALLYADLIPELEKAMIPWRRNQASFHVHRDYQLCTAKMDDLVSSRTSTLDLEVRPRVDQSLNKVSVQSTAQVDRLVHTIFACVVDEVIHSELQLWCR